MGKPTTTTTTISKAKAKTFPKQEGGTAQITRVPDVPPWKVFRVHRKWNRSLDIDTATTAATATDCCPHHQRLDFAFWILDFGTLFLSTQSRKEFSKHKSYVSCVEPLVWL